MCKGTGVRRAEGRRCVRVRGSGEHHSRCHLCWVGQKGRRAGVGSEGRRAGVGSEERRAGVGSEGRRAGVGSEGRRAGVGSEGRRAGVGSGKEGRCGVREGGQVWGQREGEQVWKGTGVMRVPCIACIICAVRWFSGVFHPPGGHVCETAVCHWGFGEYLCLWLL